MNPSILKIQHELDKMNGWLEPARAVKMYELVRALHPDNCLEIGVFAGRSLIAQALGLKDNGHGKIYGIDPWMVEPCLEGEANDANKKWWGDVDLKKIHDECLDSIWSWGVQDQVVVIQARSQDCHQIIPACDIMYIDGNHNEIASCRDVELYLPKLKQNGYLWFDDVDWPTTKKAIGMIEQKCKLHTDGGKYRLYCKI